MSKITPVVMAGGFGTRLWPLSRKSYPKQFSKLFGETSLFQSSVLRLTSSAIVDFAPHVILTNSDFRFIICDQLQQVGIDPGSILIEPEAKNTSSAILAASLFAASTDENAILLVSPSDHIISDTNEFHAAIKVGLRHVRNGKIVTFGIKPTRAETGYGYLKSSNKTLDNYGSSEVEAFVEKPSAEKATQMLRAGNLLWNAGIFLFRAKDMIDAFATFAQSTLDLVSESFSDISSDLGFLRLSAGPWSSLENISIDYAIMEKLQNLVVVPYKSHWSDVGGWDAVWLETDRDLNGNVMSNTAHSIDCTNSLLRSESTSQQVVGIGLEDIMAIAMPDAVLIAHKDRAQDVKSAVSILKNSGISQAEIAPKDYRPWGWFESLALGDSFQVKRISVKPRASLSLQSHKYRSEHWIVVEGTAKVIIEDEIYILNVGESIFVPLGAKHRMENFSELPMVLIEVQIGTYLGEDDIIRYQDDYARG